MRSLYLLIYLVFLIFTGCVKPEEEAAQTSDSALIESGDILISNTGSDSLLLFKSTGKFVKALYETLTSNGEAITGIAYNSISNEIMVLVDGADRIMAVDTVTGTTRTLVQNTGLSGNLKGITQLEGGDILVVETSAIERFTYNGIRVTTGGWPKTLQTTSSDINALPGGGFVLCSTGADVVRTYDSTGTQIATVASGIAATTDAISCVPDSDGNIYVAFSGTTDTIRKYSPDLSTIAWSFSNTGILGAPTALSLRPDGHILVTDSVFNYVVELTNDGEFSQILSGTSVDIDDVLSTPAYLFVMP
jgi:hypothetical protein